MLDKQTHSSEMTFEDFGLHELILKGIKEAGFIQPSQIQKEAIPYVLAGKDMIAQAQTGTGKTAAFGLPAINRLLTKSFQGNILIITPTRELAAQVSDELFRLAKHSDIRTVAVYGGQSIQRQVDFINRGVQVVVATPGRLLDHLKSSRLKNFKPGIVILDEADEMLDMGFLDDINEIFTYLPKERQTLLFSATMPPAIKRLAESILNQPALINVSSKQSTNTDIEQLYYVMEENERKDALIRLIDSEDIDKAIVFCRTIKETDDLSMNLASRGYLARPLHGDMEQSKRQEVIRHMQNGRLDILVATDVAARGLDISGVSHVFNYHMPFNSESYVHRIGRTGRAGKKGKAITLVTPGEFRKLRNIQNDTKIALINRSIPSIGDVRLRFRPKLVQTILEQSLNEESVEVLSMLEEQMDIVQIATKLLSNLLDQRPILGPDQIGLKGEKLSNLLKGQPSRTSRNTSTYSRGSRGKSSYSTTSNDRGFAPRIRNEDKPYAPKPRPSFEEKPYFSKTRSEEQPYASRSNRKLASPSSFGQKKDKASF